jgi:hypothetical protein
VTDDVDQPEVVDGDSPPPLSRWPVVVFGALILVASALWMSYQEYASGTRGADLIVPTDGTNGVEHE